MILLQVRTYSPPNVVVPSKKADTDINPYRLFYCPLAPEAKDFRDIPPFCACPPFIAGIPNSLAALFLPYFGVLLFCFQLFVYIFHLLFIAKRKKTQNQVSLDSAFFTVVNN